MPNPLMCGTIEWRLLSGDGTSQDLDVADWEFEFVRKRIGEASVTIPDCGVGVFDPFCDKLEVFVDGCRAGCWLVEESTPDGEGGIKISASGLVGLLEKRRWPASQRLSGLSGELWGRLWSVANSIDATGLVAGLTSGGVLLDFEAESGASMGDAVNTLSVHTTWAEHGCALYDWPSEGEPTGRPLSDGWVDVASCGSPQFDGSAVANDIEVAFTPTLDQTVQAPVGGVDPFAACRLQAPRLEFPEINDRGTAQALADLWQPRLAVPEAVLDDVVLDPAATRLLDLLPGVWHLDAVSAHAGRRFNLDAAVVSGFGGCVAEIEAGFDQGDSDVRNRIRS